MTKQEALNELLILNLKNKIYNADNAKVKRIALTLNMDAESIAVEVLGWFSYPFVKEVTQ